MEHLTKLQAPPAMLRNVTTRTRRVPIGSRSSRTVNLISTPDLHPQSFCDYVLFFAVACFLIEQLCKLNVASSLFVESSEVSTVQTFLEKTNKQLFG
jgi:hypothetical protein